MSSSGAPHFLIIISLHIHITRYIQISSEIGWCIKRIVWYNCLIVTMTLNCMFRRDWSSHNKNIKQLIVWRNRWNEPVRSKCAFTCYHLTITYRNSWESSTTVSCYFQIAHRNAFCYSSMRCSEITKHLYQCRTKSRRNTQRCAGTSAHLCVQKLARKRE